MDVELLDGGQCAIREGDQKFCVHHLRVIPDPKLITLVPDVVPVAFGRFKRPARGAQKVAPHKQRGLHLKENLLRGFELWQPCDQVAVIHKLCADAFNNVLADWTDYFGAHPLMQVASQ